MAASAGTGAGFKNVTVVAALAQFVGRAQSGKPRAQNEHARSFAARPAT